MEYSPKELSCSMRAQGRLALYGNKSRGAHGAASQSWKYSPSSTKGAPMPTRASQHAPRSHDHDDSQDASEHEAPIEPMRYCKASKRSTNPADSKHRKPDQHAHHRERRERREQIAAMLP
eukprot:m.220349 g.220349  ORF g.220349 m.220349 type:complete len:120 (+) comp10360_c0_seq1:65-424(+)